MQSCKRVVWSSLLIVVAAVVSAILVRQLRAGGSAARAEELALANNTFALDLYSHVAMQPGNVAVSPFSVHVALAMTYAGARGETAVQMANVLHLPKGRQDIDAGFAALLKEMGDTNALGCKLALANSLWGRQGYPVKRPFQKLLRDQYGAVLNLVDFRSSPEAARREINDWISNQTSGRIQEMVDATLVHSDTDLVLVNAVYFKGLWAKVFEPSLTKDLPFQLGPGKLVSVPTMASAGTFRYTETDTLQALECDYLDPEMTERGLLFYTSNRFSMVVLLPRVIDGLAELERSLTTTKLDQLRNNCRRQEVIVSLPRFKLSSGFRLAELLRDMGMSDAFSESADFSGIADVRPLFIEDVLHRVWIDVDEKGTEAAAATAVGLTHGGPDPNSAVFNANHPFLFLIRHNPSGAVLFLGRMADPTKSQ